MFFIIFIIVVVIKKITKKLGLNNQYTKITLLEKEKINNIEKK